MVGFLTIFNTMVSDELTVNELAIDIEFGKNTWLLEYQLINSYAGSIVADRLTRSSRK